MEYFVMYRRGDMGEIEAIVTAESEEEAREKFKKGKVAWYRVNFECLWADQVEVMPLGEALDCGYIS